MKAVEIKPGVFWVGGIDWSLRDFHGYKTPRGTTYNAYLILDERITLVDTVKHYLVDEMLDRVRDVVDPEKIDLIVSNHVEMDHSGSLPHLAAMLPGVEVITSANGETGLRAHFGDGLNLHAVNTGDELSIGRRTLHFLPAPMVHWPDSMETYVPEERLLLSNDGFGQHIASTERFVDEVGLDIAMEEAAKYYANIVMPYGAQVQKLLAAASELDIEMIATGHGLSWRRDLDVVLAAYTRWAANQTVPKAVIVYDTMWGSTRRLAYALQEGLEAEGVPTKMGLLQSTDVSDTMTWMLEARGILVGSPTLNSHMLPSVAGAMTYVAGLKPRNRLGLAFGSYGWGRQGVGGVEKMMDEIGWQRPVESVGAQWRPGDEELAKARAAGAQFAQAIKGAQT
jgi:flavorubredoxin